MEKSKNWTEIYENFSSINLEALAPGELESFALATYLTGNDEKSFQIYEQAHHSYLEQGELVRAIRCGFWLGLMFMNVGKKARGSGWFARTERLLKEGSVSECGEKGLLLIPAALGTLYKGQAKEAQKLFEKAVTIGKRFNDIDLIALGLLGQGQALISQGNVTNGTQLLDETMVTIETENIHPVVCGIVYCAAIETCRKVWELKRAQEWTLALTRWCKDQPDIVPFRGQCLVRRAEIIQFYGNWEEALQETREACEFLTRPPGEPAAGEAFYRKAELHRLAGGFEAAELDYHEAAKRARKPQPGLALLRLAQGRKDVAETSIRNILKETKDQKFRAALLPEVVRIMTAVDQHTEAYEATEELCLIANKFQTPYLLAKTAHCQGTVALSENNIHQALKYFQQALNLWNSINLPYETAHTRELKAYAYRELNDKDNSDIEMAAACWIYEQLNAKPDLDRIKRIVNKKKNHRTHGLTLRELQVLRRVGSGKTNKSVARELFISVRTVDRHMSNIFNKLGVSSRVEAITFALRNQLLEASN